jgi:hypothetical protein
MRKTTTWLFLVGLVMGYGAHAQQRERLTGVKVGSFDPRSQTEDWRISLQHLEAPSPDGEGYKAELLRRKNDMKRRFPERGGSGMRDTLASDTIPYSTFGMQGNLSGSSTPNDNSLAISNSGYLISAVNTNLLFYDTNADTVMRDVSLSLFLYPFTPLGSKYDPKVIYDNEADRFVLVFLNGSSATTSSIITCFSTTSNPMDLWNIYEVEGNPFNDTSWTDYPAIAVNDEDLFITGNLILSATGVSWQAGFKQTLIWQVRKDDGYTGADSLRFDLWHDLNFDGTRIRNLHPVRVGRGVYERDQYFLSNRNFSPGSDSIFVVRINDFQHTGNAQLSIQMASTSPHYHLAVNAPQADGQELATNDSRVLGAVKEGNIVHFVGNTTDTALGTSAVYHGRLNVASLQCTGHIISMPGVHFGYPNIAYTGIEYGEEQCMIVYEYSGGNLNPGLAATHYDNQGVHHGLVVLKSGDSTINMLPDALERWGDYLGIQRKYDEPCRVWCAGTYGNGARKNATWIARIQAEHSCRSLPVPLPPEPPYAGEYNGVIFPNPVADMFSFAFTMEQGEEAEIALFDDQGRKVKVLLEDYINAGQNLFTFNTVYLRTGLYLLTVTTSSGRKYTEKLVVE